MLNQNSPADKNENNSQSGNESVNAENSKLVSIVTRSDTSGRQQIHEQPKQPKNKGWLANLCSCFISESSDFNPITNAEIDLLPPQSLNKLHKKTLCLDLDETLVHSQFQPVETYDFLIYVEVEMKLYPVYVLVRPGAKEILEELAEYYELVIFTASLDKYANPLLDKLDPYGHIDYRLYRQHCTTVRGSYVKDLTKLGRDMGSVIIVDNSPQSYFLQPENAILSKTWMFDKECNDLFHLSKHLQTIANVDDVRKHLPKMNKPELYGEELVPKVTEDVEIAERGVFNSPKAAEDKKFEFGKDEGDEELDQNDSYSSVNID